MKKLFFSVAFVVILTQALPSHASVAEVEAFVTRFYEQCLNRQPDQPGLDYWTNSLLSGTLTGADVAWDFVFSQEFTNLNTSNGDYLTVLYRAFFDRQPDAGGLAYWLDEFNNGASREDVLNGFVHANEFVYLAEQFDVTPFCPCTWHKDLDRDGYSDGVTLTQNSQPPGYYLASGLVSTSGDCNDTDASVHPGAVEICSNGIDEDCSGSDSMCSAGPDVVLASINESEFGGDLVLYGELQNIGNTDGVLVEIEFSFMDINGALLGTDFTYVSGTTKTLTSSHLETNAILTPGEVGFFVLYTFIPRNNVANYNDGISWDDDDTEYPDSNIRLVEPLNPFECTFGGWCVDGLGENIGTQPAVFTWVEFYLKDSAGNVIGWDLSSIDGLHQVDLNGGVTTDAIYPGETGPFSAGEYGLSFSDVSSYDWKLDWSDYVPPVTSAFSFNTLSVESSGSTNLAGESQKREYARKRTRRIEAYRSLLAE